MLGTLVAIEAFAGHEADALAAIELACEAMARVDRLMHPFRPGSDVARINAAPCGVSVPLDFSTWSVLRLAQRVCQASGGVFDPCLPQRPGGLTDLELSAADEPYSALCRRPLCLDLGGIAKGYAIDCATDALRAAGCVAGVVNAGGDLRLFGPRRQTILLRHADGECEPLLLENTALAVSDTEARHRPREHRGYYRREGSGSTLRRCAAVLAPEAAAADALTKCVLLGPQSHAARALHEFRGVELTGVLDS